MSESEADGRRPDPRRNRRRHWCWVGAAVVALLLLGAGGFYLWATTTPDPGPRALAALESDDQVRVIEDDGYTFQPTQPAQIGFILYPGGRVDPASYAAPARDIAEAGYLVIVPQLTLNLAVLDANAADDIVATHPDIDHWVIGGHSLGGTMAAGYELDNPETISGHMMWAAYPANDTDLSLLDTAVASVDSVFAGQQRFLSGDELTAGPRSRPLISGLLGML